MARKSSLMKRVSPELVDAIGLCKKEAKKNLGIDISDVDATAMISKRYKQSSFLKKDIDKDFKLL